MDERQRELCCANRLRTIQKELGETDARQVEIQELTEAIAKAKMPKEAEAQAKKELRRLERMPEGAGIRDDPGISGLADRTALVETEPDRIDIADARRILDEDHYGLEKVKRRILEFSRCASSTRRAAARSCASLARPALARRRSARASLARLGREFVRVSLGGVHDEAEIRGHRRTYIGAMPGRIIQSLAGPAPAIR